jgi:hypothetical protein
VANGRVALDAFDHGHNHVTVLRFQNALPKLIAMLEPVPQICTGR